METNYVMKACEEIVMHFTAIWEDLMVAKFGSQVGATNEFIVLFLNLDNEMIEGCQWK